jgi:hypothetical protein
MMAIFVGNTPQNRPSDMLTSVRIYDKIGLSEEEVAQHDGRPLAELLSAKDVIQIDLDAQEAKFVARIMVENGNFGARRLKHLIPLWERLYTKWEEFGQERPGRERRQR